MSMTIEYGLTAAINLARRNVRQYAKAVQQYGSRVDMYLGEAPRTLLLSHILRINPQLVQSPVFKDQREGFMGVTPLQASTAEVDMSKISENPAICAYVYSRELNRVSYNLYTTYPDLFTEPREDLWRCAYLRTTLGDVMFNALWSLHPPVSTDDNIYEVLRYSVNTMRKSLMGIRASKVKVLVLKDCEFVFQLALLKGSLSTSGPGIEPVPASSDAADLFTETRNGGR